VVVAILVLLVTIPFPVRVKGLALIQVEPSHVQRVVIPETGAAIQRPSILVKRLVVDGQLVQAGDALAILDNPDLEIAYKLNEREQELLSQQMSALTNLITAENRTSRAAAEYNAALSQLDGLRTQFKELRLRKDALTLRAPCDGRVMKLIRREEEGKAQEPGALVCEVADDRHLQAVLLVETAEHNLVKPGSDAWIRVHGRGYNYWPGKVSEIASVESKDIPPQLSNKAGGEIPATEDPESKALVPQQQHYLIAVRFTERDDAIQPGAMGRVKIEAEPQTLWWRFHRYLATTFHWGL
jgi:multidrug resistance efflux pump